MMKKRILSTLLAVMLLSVLLAGCAPGNPSGNTPSPTPPVTDPAPSGNAESEAMVASIVAEAQSAIGGMEEMFGGLFGIEITAQGETIVYTFTFGETLEGDMLGTMQSSLKDSMSDQKATFTGIVDVMREAGVENPAVRVEYLNSDGTEIFSTVF